MLDTHTLVTKLKALSHELGRNPTRAEYLASGVSDYSVRHNGGFRTLVEMAGLPDIPEEDETVEPRVLLLDIETAPMEAYVYGLFDQNVSLNQIKKDWYVLSWSAKWLGAPEEEVMYADIRDTPGDDSGILSQVWQLLDMADVVIGHNSESFDIKKLNARFLLNGFPPPSSFRQIDTLKIARRYFALTSRKLAYLTDKLCTKYKKLEHGEFPGMSLWVECLKGNEAAWKCNEEYNRYDVLSLEELYLCLRRWSTKVNFNAFSGSLENKCACGSTSFKEHGYIYKNSARYRRYICSACGAEYADKNNLLSKVKRASLKELSL